MKSIRIHSLFCLFLNSPIFVFYFYSSLMAQELRLSGSVLDHASRLPIEFASAAVYRNDSTLVSGTLTDSTGKFELRNLNPGSYYLAIAFLGYEKLIVPNIVLSRAFSPLELGDVELKASAYQLEEVSVSSRGLSMRIAADRQIIEAKHNEVAAGGSAADLLRTSPIIREDHERKLTIHGDANFTVLINGQATDLPSQDVLKQTPAWQIDKIEIMTHPSARFSSGGTAGIINIILKKNAEHGLNGLVTVMGGLYDKYSSGAQLNLNSNKIQTTLSIDWKNEKINQNHNYYKKRTFNDTLEHASMLQDRHLQERSLEARWNATYNPNTNTKWNYSLHCGQNKRNFYIKALLEGYTDPMNLQRFDQNEFKMELRPTYLTQNLAYIRQLPKPGSSISANFYYSYIDYHLANSQVQIQTDSNFEPLDSQPHLHNVLNNNFSKESKFDIDYIYPLKKNIVFETGVSYRIYNRNLNVLITDYNYELNDWVDDARYTGIYKYYERIYSGYINARFNLSDIKVTTGVRVEYMARSLDNTESGVKFPFSRLHFFPNVLAEKSINDQWMITANYSSRINRPDEYQMNPFPEFEDPYFYAEGNPELLPEISHRTEAGFRRIFNKGSLNASMFYRTKNDRIFQELIVRPDGKLKVISSNRAKEQSFGFDLNSNISVAPWVSLQAGLSAFHYKIKGVSGIEAFNNSSFIWNANVMGSFQVHKNISMQIASIFNSRETYALGYSKEIWLMNLGIDWRFLNDQFTANFSIQDIFNTGDFFVHTSSEGTLLDAYYFNEHPSMRLSLKYYFRKYKKLTSDVETKFDM